jgi:hypothetical protein
MGLRPAVPVASQAATSPPEPAQSNKPETRFFVQTAAPASESEARQSLARSLRFAGAPPPGVSQRVSRVVVSGTTRYRAQFAGFRSSQAATAFCKALAAKGQACMVSREE